MLDMTSYVVIYYILTPYGVLSVESVISRVALLSTVSKAETSAAISLVV